jgi:coenzyme F420-dependent glucose-6-phosphate dehydrogenase
MPEHSVPPDAMVLGWWLSSEEHGPRDLVARAEEAESSGFTTAMISDHLQPWVPAQAHAGHVWTTLGAIAHATERLEVGTGVTAMVHRSHPLTIAHAAATAAMLFEDRFFLGVGTGERLNEQPYGKRWPRPGARRRWLEDALGVLREVWAGGTVNISDGHWPVEGFRLFERPASPPAVYVAASGRRSAQLAAAHGDGLIAVATSPRLVESYRSGGGRGPVIGQLHVSLADTVEHAIDAAWRWWPNGALAPRLLTELARPRDFSTASDGLRRDTVHRGVLCAVDAETIVAEIDRRAGAGFDRVYLHQIGPDQQRLMELCRAELLPHYARR